jgi:hypothetical protein
MGKRQEVYNHYIATAISLKGVSAARILELYRMRRETGLVFKQLKSLFHYNEIPSKLEGTRGMVLREVVTCGAL